MAEAHPSLALDTHSQPSAHEHKPLTSPRTLLSVSESSEESTESDTAPEPTTRPTIHLESHSKQIEDDLSEPPYPPFNIWNFPRGAKIPLESYREMTLACRFVPTDQWLTTRVDRTWTVSQVKHHMLTKIWGGRRYQLALPRNITHPTKPGTQEGAGRASGEGGEDGSRRMSISSSDYSSVVFASTIPGDYERSHCTFDTVINASSASLEHSVNPDTPDGGRTPRLTRSLSSNELTRGRSASSSSSHRRGQSVSGQRPPSNRSDSMIRDLRREEAMDRLYERMEQTVKRRVLRAAKNYRVVSFSNGNVLDDKDPLSTYGIKPFELLEIQPATQCIRLARPTYLEPYFETDSMVRVRGGAEKHGVEFLKRLQQLQQEEKAKAELSKAMSALGMDEEQNRPGNEWGTGLSAVTKQRNLEERKEEERRRVLLEQARRDEEKKKKRERKEQESEKWKYRKMIVEGHDLNLWRDHLYDAFPEQSWDLRRVVEVKIPRPQKTPQPISSTQSAYAAVAFSSNLQSVSTRAPEKATKKEVQNEVLDQPTLHIRFSIPLSSVHASLNPAAAAAIHAARLKRAAKANPGSTYLAESLATLGAASTRRLDSTDPYNQGIGFGTSTLEGAGTASLVLRFPNERTREHFCRIIHRSAGKYPLAAKNRRKLAFEPVADLIPIPDPDPERTREHGAPFPEWRARVLKKSIASGRSGFLSSSAWGAVFNEATGLYCKSERVSGANDKGKGPAMPYGGDMEEGYQGDEDDCASLVSDTEWEGWRRELEMDMPPRNLPTIISGTNTGATATPKAAHSIATIKEDVVLPSGNLSAIAPENIARSDEEARLLTPIQPRNPPLLPRKDSLQLAKRVVVEGIAGKGLIMPATNTYASWTSFSSNSSVNSSSFLSHEEYRAGEGSDTTANRKPRLTPIVTDPARATGSRNLARAKSATVFSSNPNVAVPRVSSSAPLSAAMDSHDAWKSALSSSSPPNKAVPAAEPEPEPVEELYDDLPAFNPDVILPGMGGGLGNPAMFPAYVDMGATVTTVTSGRQVNGGKKSTGKSGGKWLAKSFAKGTDESSDNATTSVLASLSRRSSGTNVANIVRNISKRDRDRS